MSVEMFLDQEIASPFHQITVMSQSLDEMRKVAHQKDEKILEQGKQLSQKNGQLSQKNEQLSKLEGENIELLQDSIVSVLQSHFPNELPQSVCNYVQSIKEKTSLKKIFQFSLKDALPTINTKLELICSGF